MDIISLDIERLTRIIADLNVGEDLRQVFGKWLASTPEAKEFLDHIEKEPRTSIEQTVSNLFQNAYPNSRKILDNLIGGLLKENIKAEDREYLNDLSLRTIFDSANSDAPMNRSRLITFLEGLTRPQLTQVVTRVPAIVSYDNDFWDLPTRVSKVIAFAESSGGPGLGKIALALRDIFPQLVESVSKRTEAVGIVRQEQLDLRSLIQPGGTLSVDSEFYVKRTGVQKAIEELHTPAKYRKIVVLRGARQTGKSTFLAAVVAETQQKQQLRAFSIDFQNLPLSCFDSSNSLWFRITKRMASDFGLVAWSSDDWDDDTGWSMNRFLERHLFNGNATPVLLCMDEVDRVLDKPAGKDFFSLTRSFINDGANHPNWQKLRWLLSTSTEPDAFITNIHESPFNVGDAANLELEAFTEDEINDLIGRYGQVGTVTAEEIMEYVGGRPFLTNLVLYHMAGKHMTKERLWKTEETSKSVFEPHLKRYLSIVRNDPTLNKAMVQIVHQLDCEDKTTYYRLKALNLVIQDSAGKVIASCRLYREYFKHMLTL